MYRLYGHETFRGVPVSVIVAELERIRSGGDLTPQAVVDAARLESSPLHPIFEWRDDVAAERYRLMQARWLLRRIEVHYVHCDADGRPQWQARKLYVNTKTEQGQRCYLRHMDVVRSSGRFYHAVRQLARQAEALLQSTSGLVHEVDSLLSGHDPSTCDMKEIEAIMKLVVDIRKWLDHASALAGSVVIELENAFERLNGPRRVEVVADAC